MRKYKIAELVTLNKKQNPMTNSLKVAQKFGKRHDNVVRDIRELGCSERFSLLNFEERKYTIRGKSEPYFEMTRDGFSILAMGYTGKEAMIWKEKYIALFNKLEKALIWAIKNQKDPGRIKARESGKAMLKLKSDFINDEFIPYAIAQATEAGEVCGYAKKPSNCYMNYNRLVKLNVFNVAKGLKNPRDYMTTEQLGIASGADAVNLKTMREFMSENMEYHDIYKEAKKKIIIYADLVGKTDVPFIQIEHNAPKQIALF